MKRLYLFFSLLVLAPLLVSAQNFEVNGGWAHISGDGGLDGFNVGAAVWFTPRVSIAADYDDTWDSSHLGVFELTQTGTIISKTHLQDGLVGPRIFFPGLLRNKQKHIAKLFPFFEAELGASNEYGSLQEPTMKISQSASDNAFTWMLGGGADYAISGHWVGRARLDFLRTHFADTGQSRARLVLGVVYTVGKRNYAAGPQPRP